MPVQEPVKQLIAILTGQRDCYAALLRLAKQKHQAILADDLRTIERTLEQEQVLTTALGRLERDRLALADQIAAYLQLPLEQLNLTSILERVDHPTRHTLIGLRDEIARDLQHIERLNHSNSELLEKALHRVNRSLQMLGANTPSPTTYGPRTHQPTQKSKQQPANILDRKI